MGNQTSGSEPSDDEEEEHVEGKPSLLKSLK